MVFSKPVVVVLAGLATTLVYAQSEIHAVHWVHVLITGILVFISAIGINRSA